jgi:hypothetical protein
MFKRALLRQLLLLHWASRKRETLQRPSPLALLRGHEKTQLALIADCAGVERGRKPRNAQSSLVWSSLVYAPHEFAKEVSRNAREAKQVAENLLLVLYDTQS